MMSSAPSPTRLARPPRARPPGVPRSSLTRMVRSGFWNSARASSAALRRLCADDRALAGAGQRQDQRDLDRARCRSRCAVGRRGRGRAGGAADAAGRRRGCREPMQPASAQRQRGRQRPAGARTRERAMHGPQRAAAASLDAGPRRIRTTFERIMATKSKRCFRSVRHRLPPRSLGLCDSAPRWRQRIDNRTAAGAIRPRKRRRLHRLRPRGRGRAAGAGPLRGGDADRQPAATSRSGRSRCSPPPTRCWPRTRGSRRRCSPITASRRRSSPITSIRTTPCASG